MLTEGKLRKACFRVVYYLNGEHGYEYTITHSAQDAVDQVRSQYPEAEFVEVAKVVNNWK